MATTDIPSDKREFRCSHCNGKILIPRELPPTTGPCPHCSGVITSPALESAVPADIQPRPLQVRVPVPQAPVQQEPAPVAESRMPQVPPTQSQPVRVPPVPEKIEVPAAKVEIPHASDPSQANKRKTEPARVPDPVTPPPKRGLIPVMLVLLLLIAGAGTAVYLVANELGRKVPAPTISSIAKDPAIAEANYIRVGWQKDAYQVLEHFIAATSTKDKLPFILRGAEMESKLQEFYGDSAIDDSDTSAKAFFIYDLPEQDRKRGLFMMIYDQPPQCDLKEFFRPLASLEVQYGIDEADLLLSTVSRLENFAMEPLRVHAFFKRTPEGLKLDWEMFVQTKFRTFEDFVELPEVGKTGVFRVMIAEDVPDKGRPTAGTRTYRIGDPANITDSARINVRNDSNTGRSLSIINWLGSKHGQPITRTATVELKWSGEANAPNLEISRFVCWEFLGLGGEETPATASTK